MKDVEIIKARNVLSSRARTNLAKRLRVAAYCRVSTDSEDQLNSYKSQVQHYTDLIKSKSEWDLAGIYADEAITGTQVTKREDFQRLINDCMNGDVDMIITKSISRFARNTLDTLKYVRMLKEKGIAVFFEEENINTLTMDGELLLVILSSVAQQEVENISANVKKGLKMKMQRGELVGFQGCLGYDYHPEDKSISINEEEAEIVRYIFRRYIEGAGGSVIAQELENLGYKTKRGSTRWAETTVIGIIKNEKYKGDILMGKTFTLDPISKRRLDNFGEEDQFYIRDHHEAIISEEMFEKAQEILKRRAKPRRLGTDGKREKFSRKYAFSCMLECGFCGGTLTRRSWHSGSQYNKVIWQCVTATKKGKKFCPDSKGIAEETIEQAFIESYRLLCQNNKDVLDEFIARTEETLSDSNASKQLAKVEKDIAALDAKRAKLVDMRLEEIIDKETYEQKYFDLSSQIEQLQKQRESLQESAETESTMKKRIAEFRRTLEENEVLDTFDRYVFESIVEKVIVGGYDEDGNKDPAMLTFIYKTGFKNSLDGTNFKPPRKNSKAAKQNAGLCSHTTDEAKSMCSYHSDDTCGVCSEDSSRRIICPKKGADKMALPKYDELYVPFLTVIKDGQLHTAKAVAADVAELLHLSAEDLTEQLPSQRQTVFVNRLNWAKTYLKKAGLVDTPSRGNYVITAEGKRLVDNGVSITNAYLKQHYASFAAFVGNEEITASTASTPSLADVKTPEEQMDALHKTINDTLADDLLSEIMQQTPVFFEQLVVDLMKTMDYRDGFKTKYSGDDGIDGVIHEDKLGFNLIYIQAKRWNPDVTIGKPELQKFFGAMMGPPRVEKGLFITTAKFSKGAREYADAQHIILVDGQKLTSLMIEYGLGVSVQKVYKLKRIDSDYFAEEI